ncbi:pentapeptide repeat-containing protein [Haloarchaeobius sp. HRN-SO-5]|uniref:pentapeptide repeat-containing protein n=1 Tax=Haloarchaeobius sp. HRN-SO-5 TaxID=3446118 RepID=UPI003EB7E068
MTPPNTTCGFQLDVADIPVGVSQIRCNRETWQDGRCILHADSEQKELDSVCEALADQGPRIDAPKLQNIDFGDSFDFSKYTLYCADFSGANLEGADFNAATLRKAKFINSTLDHVDFLDDADLSHAKLTNSTLRDTRFTGSNLQNATLKNTTGLSIKCQNAKLMDADFTGSELSDGNFLGANLREATLSQVDLRGTLCIGCNLERADLSEADLRDCSLSLSKLHEADVRNIQADHRTNFGEEVGVEEQEAINNFDEQLIGIENEILNGDSIGGLDGKSWYEATADRDAESRSDSDPIVPVIGRVDTLKYAVKRFTNRALSNEASNPGKLETATHVYRDYQRIFEENQLHEKRRKYHIRQKSAQRKAAVEDSNWLRWFKLALARFAFLHGESPRRVVESSAFLALLFAVVYPVFGVQNAKGTTFNYVLEPAFSWEAVYATVSLSLARFLNAPNSDYHAIGFGRIIVSTETVLGALFLALFVFTLGRRATE